MTAFEVLLKFTMENEVSVVFSYVGDEPRYRMDLVRNGFVHTVYLDVKFLKEIGDDNEFFEYFLNNQLSFLDIKEGVK